MYGFQNGATHSSHLNTADDTCRLWNWQAVLPQTSDMESNCFAQFLFDILNGRASGNASWQIWNIAGVPSSRLFDHDRVAHYILRQQSYEL